MKKLRVSVSGLGFAEVARAMGEGMHNISSYELREGGELESFLREQGLQDVPVILMADHSLGTREWTPTPGSRNSDFPFYEEKCFNGGWYVLTEDNAIRIHCESCTSGSSLMAEKQEDGTWAVTLEVPWMETGPYKGSYWKTFHRGLGLEVESTGKAVSA